MSLRLLITGANGQVGWHLQRTLAPLGEVTALTRDDLDLADLDAVDQAVRELTPDALVNAAAYTAVDRAESEPELTAAVEEFVMRLNGRQTIYQMIQLAEEVSKRGGQPLPPLEYKHRYHDLLMARIQDRLTALADGSARGVGSGVSQATFGRAVDPTDGLTLGSDW